MVICTSSYSLPRWFLRATPTRDRVCRTQGSDITRETRHLHLTSLESLPVQTTRGKTSGLVKSLLEYTGVFLYVKDYQVVYIGLQTRIFRVDVKLFVSDSRQIQILTGETLTLALTRNTHPPNSKQGRDCRGNQWSHDPYTSCGRVTDRTTLPITSVTRKILSRFYI